MRLGLFGFGEHPWQSVDRTRRFYLRALASAFDLCYPEAASSGWFDPLPDAVLNFAGSRGWSFDRHPECPLLFGMHGGPVLDQVFLQDNLSRLETTDVLLVNCASDVTILREMFVGATPRICRLPLPVDPAHFRPLGRAACRKQLGLDEFEILVGFVGRLLPQKGLHYFLQILAELKERLRPRPVGGLIVGDYWADYPVLGYVTEAYPQWIASLIAELDLADNLAYYPANLSDDDLALRYGALDLLIHPTNSLDENFGYAPIEAMACGTPVLGAAYGGLKDTIVSGETGYLMPTWVTQSGIRMDRLSGIDAAQRMLTNAALWQQMSAAALQRARQSYSYTTCAEILCTAVEAAVAARKSGAAQPLTMASPRPQPGSAGLLPALAKPWEHYQDVVAHYVSGLRPTPRAESQIQVAAPLAVREQGTLRLLDPAWPAECRIDPAQQAIVERCRRVTTVAELERSGVARAQLQPLIDTGLLICTD